ncbi:MAG: SDR family NAD(P)-dependent oxidoreductase [Thermonemataceae bacterium]|nr:SDR family NAD(P)-dependent oxidoreductase [Thermonemataceae bacterium]
MRKLLTYILFPPPNISYKNLDKNLRGKTLLITGASYGIGEHTARILANAGISCRLILTARSTEKLIALQKELQSEHCEVQIFSADLYQAEGVETLITFIKSAQPIDIFISNAGKSIRRSIWQSLERPQDLQRTAQLNYLTPTRLVMALLPLLRTKKGHIIHVSAASVLLPPMPYWAFYQASKVAFEQWFEAIQPELKCWGIRTSAVYFPLVRTRMIEPNELYKNAPAMPVEQAAKHIISLIATPRKKFQPWWLGFLIFLAFFFGKILSWLNDGYARKNMAHSQSNEIT